MNYCCEKMKKRTFISKVNKSSNPDKIIKYVPYFSEYGLPIFDGGNSYTVIKFCPWCGNKLPASRRDEWMDFIEKLGYSFADSGKIPKKYFVVDWEKYVN